MNPVTCVDADKIEFKKMDLSLSNFNEALKKLICKRLFATHSSVIVLMFCLGTNFDIKKRFLAIPI